MNAKKNRIYLDYCATTPIRPEVVQAMLPALEDTFGNPSSLHAEGRAGAELLRSARTSVAASLRASPEEVVFTSGATEADNLALAGIMQALSPNVNHLITSAIEHHAVLHAAERLSEQDIRVTVLPVDGYGRVDPQALMDSIEQDTGLVSIMTVNNEVGTVQPVHELARIAHDNGLLFHTDAVQGVSTTSLSLAGLPADAISLSGHKIYGPKGIGCLLLRKDLEIKPLLHGGPQEMERRAGTENVAGAAGFATALQLSTEHRNEIYTHLSRLRQRLLAGLQELLPEAHVNGHPSHFAAHVLSVTFPGVEAEMALYLLDQEGIAASMGSACNAESIEPSHVLLAMGISRADIAGTIRFSFGLPTAETDLDRLLEVLPGIVERARGA
jgi:cysteine desulfurase